MYSEEKQERISKEFSRLRDITYLDHAGATLYADGQVQAIAKDLCDNVYGNPHSLSTSSRYATDVVDQMRFRVLSHFNTDPDEYSIVFTSGATQSLKIVAESFDWKGSHMSCDSIYSEDGSQSGYSGSAGAFVYLQDNHTSVLGMRELAAEAGASVHSLSHEDAFRNFQGTSKEGQSLLIDGNSLFVYPAQCNFSGVKYPLSWIKMVHAGALNKEASCSRWFCLLDAASFVSTNPLDLSKVKPDFVCMSFYKIFGYPTGLGALLVKNTSANILKRNYFGGGTVLMCLSSQQVHVPRPKLSDRFEDGTLPFLSIVALHHGFNTLQNLAGSLASVAEHTFSLSQYLFRFLLALHHSNGTPAAKLYCDTDYENINTQGNVVNFNMLRPSGEYVGFVEVLNMANLHGIQLRTGCFCNPGACQRHLHLTDSDIRRFLQAGHVCGDETDLIDGQPTGSVRISFGYMTTKRDVDNLINMLVSCFVHGTPIKKVPAWWSNFQQEYLQKFSSKNYPENPEPVPSTEAKIKDLISQISTFSLIPREETQSSSAVLSHIYLYPVKSCGALKVDTWVIGPRGFLYDREWMIVTPSGVCLTQKQETRLCLIQPLIDLAKGLLTLHFSGLATISVPLDTPLKGVTEKKQMWLCESKVCGDRVQGWDCGDDIASWLSEALNRPGLRLIRQWSSDLRLGKGSKKISAPVVNEKPVLSLSNQAQFLLISENSVRWLSDQINHEEADCEKDSLLERFRSNLVVQGVQPFAENEWTSLQIGKVKFQSEGPCTRCQMICIDQSTGVKTREPLRTLAAVLHGKMRFGVYLSQRTDGEDVKISVGDQVMSYSMVN